MILSKPLPVFEELPELVKKIIVEHLDFLTKMSIRLCSKQLKKLVDASKSFIPSLTLALTVDRNLFELVRLELDSGPQTGVVELDAEEIDQNGLSFVRNNINRSLLTIGSFQMQILDGTIANGVTRETYNERKGFLLQRLNELLGNPETEPKLKVHTFSLCFEGDQDFITAMLPHLEPGTLQSIQFSKPVAPFFWRIEVLEFDTLELDRVVQSEQWKMASGWFESNYLINLVPEHLKHFTHTKTRRQQRFQLDEFKHHVELMIATPTWKSCVIRINTMYAAYEIDQYLNNTFPCISGALNTFKKYKLTEERDFLTAKSQTVPETYETEFEFRRYGVGGTLRGLSPFLPQAHYPFLL